MTITAPKPQAKANLIHQQILGGLIATKPVSWECKTLDPHSPNPNKPLVIKTTVTGTELVNGLARNVSEQNVDRAAQRWIA